MLSPIIYILIIFGSLIGGALVMFLIYGFYGFLGGWFIKRKLPKDKSKIEEHIKKNPEKFKSPGKPEVTEKEVKEHGFKQFERFREFEQLRRDAGLTRGNSQITGDNYATAKSLEAERHRGMANRPNGYAGVTERDIGKFVGKDEPNRQEYKITRPHFE